MAKERTPDPRRSRSSGAARSGSSRSGGSSPGTRGKGGRTRPTTTVVSQQRPWSLIAGALAVVVFAAAVIVYAVAQVNKANADKITSPEQIAGVKSYDYSQGQEHVTTPVEYKESPPVGGPHDPNWADCTGSVYTVDIRHENAVHSMEHGAVWITYDPGKVDAAGVAKLAKLVDGTSGRMLSPYPGLDSAVSVQSWNHQLKLDSVDDKRIAQYADFFTRNSDYYPEIGASCENPDFLAHPLVAGQASTPVGPTDMPTTPSPSGSTTP